MHLAILILSAALALDGESVNNPSTGLDVISVVSIGLGWVALAALWFFVFRDKSRSKRKKDSSD